MSLRTGALAAALLVSGCASPGLKQFTGTTPAFDPVTFFTGHVVSWGVLEDRSGYPTEAITTDCQGTLEAPDSLHLVQHLTEGKDQQTRDWHMHRVSPTHFEATANDVVGVASGDVEGRVFHWTFVLALKPGNALENVTLGPVDVFRGRRFDGEPGHDPQARRDRSRRHGAFQARLNRRLLPPSTASGRGRRQLRSPPHEP